MIEKNIKNLIRIRSLLLSYKNQSTDLQSNISMSVLLAWYGLWENPSISIWSADADSTVGK